VFGNVALVFKRLLRKEWVMIDHVGFAVRDCQLSKDFYARGLLPLGVALVVAVAAAAAGVGKDAKPSFWIEASGELSGDGFTSR
jgi:catechol 2,3-dioxygenase-like lactoylglutathione lyase family enzyme